MAMEANAAPRAAKIFISHAGFEAPLALELKRWIEDVFPGLSDVFVSSHVKDLPPGEKWADRLASELDQMALMIVLCSPSSVERAWINFECGAGYARKLRVIPVCHSGLSKTRLRDPLRTFQGVDLDDATSAGDLLLSVAQNLGLPKAPPVDVSRMRTDLLDATVREPEGYELFVSSPMVSLADPPGYEAAHETAMAAIAAARETHGWKQIYYAGEKFPTLEDVDPELVATEKDLAALNESARFMLILPQSLVTSAFVEAGWALAKGIPSVFFVRDRKDLPYLLREANQVHGVRTLEYESRQDLARQIRTHGDYLFPEER